MTPAVPAASPAVTSDAASPAATPDAASVAAASNSAASTIANHVSVATDPAAGAATLPIDFVRDKGLVAALQQRFRPAGGGHEPPPMHIAIAIKLARGDRDAKTVTVCKDHGIKPGSVSKKIDGWRKRILEEDLLAACIELELPAIDPAVADEERRAKRAKLERDRYAAERDVQETLSSLIRTIEQREYQEWKLEHYNLRIPEWHCPAGCTSGCARQHFRQQCAPTPQGICNKGRQLWLAKHPEPTPPTMRCSDGRWRSYAERHERWQSQMPVFEITEANADALSAMSSEFLETWDGKISPASWLKWRLEHDEAPMCSRLPDSLATRHNEYRGENCEQPSADALAACRYKGCAGCSQCCSNADRFGSDFRPVGPAACARCGCSGCCYCIGQPLPIYVEVQSYHIPGSNPALGFSTHPGPWLSIYQLRRWINGLASSSNSSAPAPDALPAYLLCRQCKPAHRDGRAICVAGDVRNHVSTEELDEWRESLTRRASIHR